MCFGSKVFKGKEGIEVTSKNKNKKKKKRYRKMSENQETQEEILANFQVRNSNKTNFCFFFCLNFEWFLCILMCSDVMMNNVCVN